MRLSMVKYRLDPFAKNGISPDDSKIIKQSNGYVSAGKDGKDGTNGIGVIAGGTTGQALVKKSNTDYDTEWKSISGGTGTSDHAELTNLDYASSGHTGFQPAGTYLESVVAGTGISVDDTDPENPVVTNTAPDQVVSLTGAGTTSITGTYPSFTITSTGGEGGGDVTGPASSTDDNIATFNGITGKIIQDGGVKISDLQPAGDYLTEETDPVYSAWDKDHGDLINIGTNTHAQIDTKLASLLYDRETMKDPTGFTNNDAITVTYNSTTRKITLTGTFEAYYRGEKIAALVDGWESAAHATTLDKTYFLYYDGTNFVFSDSPWTFDALQIAYVQYGTSDKIAIKETHGFMDWHAHQEFHNTIGAYRTAGGTLTALSYALNSTTAADRRPLIDATTMYDEDLKHVINALSSESYTQKYLSGAGGTRTFVTGASDIIPVTGVTPYWNQYTGGAWQQTAMQNNEYAAVWLTAIPVTSDAGSQAYRYIWTQPQSVGTLAQINALTTNDLNIGDTALLVSEFVFLAKIVIQMTGNDWQLVSVTNLTGNRYNQTGSPSGTYLSTVAHDATLTGSGTAGDPLVVVSPFTDEKAQDAVGNSVGNGLDYDDNTGAISVDETELAHNSLGSKQGGTTNEYYHITAAQATVVGNTSNTNTGDETQSTIKTKLGAATALADGYATSTQIAKLDGIAAGAEVNVQADWNQATNTADDYIKNKPTLGALAAKNSVDYSTAEVTNKPTLGTAAAKNIPATGDASVTEVVYGTDTRLTDARTPSAHNQAESTITFTNITTGDASTSAHGYAPKATAPGSGLYNYIGITNGETVYTNKALFDATAPSTQAFGDSAATGSATVAARRDHKHAMPAAPTNATTCTIANEATDTTCFPTFVTAATGSLGHKSNANLTYDSSAAKLTSPNISVDYITEKTSGNGVNIDGMIIKDNGPTGWDGWQIANETWAYASVDGPTGVITIPTNGTTKYSVGMRVKFTQTTVKYGIITAIAATSMTIYTGTGTALTNATISANFYSSEKTPFGFPTSPASWTVVASDTTGRAQATPTVNVWYNLGSISISIPIGAWKVKYSLLPYSYRLGTNDKIQIETTLSTANNSASDASMTRAGYSGVYVGAAAAEFGFSVEMSRPEILVLAAKTTYYINTRTINANMSSLNNQNATQALYITAECAYL